MSETTLAKAVIAAAFIQSSRLPLSGLEAQGSESQATALHVLRLATEAVYAALNPPQPVTQRPVQLG